MLLSPSSDGAMKAACLYGAFADSRWLVFRLASAARRISDRRNGRYAVPPWRQQRRSLGNIASYPSAPRDRRDDARPPGYSSPTSVGRANAFIRKSIILQHTVCLELLCSSCDERSKAGLLLTYILKRILMNSKPMMGITTPAADTTQAMAVSCSSTRKAIKRTCY